MEVNNALVLLASLGALVLYGGQTVQVIGTEMAGRLSGLGAPEITPAGICRLASHSFFAAGRAVAPLLLGTALVGLLCSLAQSGFLFAPAKLKPKLSAISPIQGFKNLISMAALMRLVTAGLSFYMLLIMFRILLSWFQGQNFGKPVEFLAKVTDPYLRWFRRFEFLRVGNFDFSVIVARRFILPNLNEMSDE